MLTEEQRQVVTDAGELAPGEILKVEACAGSGKTSTLVEVARANPDKQFLYLAFNKSIVTEAKKRFPDNVQVSTTHSLAYRWYASTHDAYRLKNLSPGFRPVQLKAVLPHLSLKDISQALSAYRAFCQSAQLIPDPAAQQVWDAINQGRLPLTHDHYLKLWQLEGQQRFAGVDCLLLDEAQDTNPVTMAIFLDNQCSKLLVGDSHQSIYAFRGAINALNSVSAQETLHLSHSFRTMQPILDQANFFVSSFSKDAPAFVPMKSLASAERQLPGKALLSRTNSYLAGRICDIPEEKLKEYRLLRPAEAIFNLPLSLLALSKHHYQDITSDCSWLRNFKSLPQVEEYAAETDDQEIQRSVQLVKKHLDNLHGIFEKARAIYGNEQAKVDLATAHSAKGLEWNFVTLADDFPDLASQHQSLNSVRQDNKISPEKFEQELNLYYVALTRAGAVLKDKTENAVYYRRCRHR